MTDPTRPDVSAIKARAILGRGAPCVHNSDVIALCDRILHLEDRVVEQADSSRRLLLNLLAVIHRDGGQHTDSVGVSRSAADAHEAWAALMVMRDECPRCGGLMSHDEAEAGECAHPDCKWRSRLAGRVAELETAIEKVLILPPGMLSADARRCLDAALLTPTGDTTDE